MTQKNSWNCIIIEDDELDRLVLASYIRPYSFLRITGIFESAEKASAFMENNEIDVVFSDIDMPGVSGIALRREWLNIPICIFVTSYPDYAAESFDVFAFDFMVKPLNFDRFSSCMQRCEAYFNIREKAELFDLSLGDNVIFVKDGHREIKVPLHQIIYLEALRDYTQLVTAQKRYTVLSPIGSLLKAESFSTFIRVHRSYAVQKHFIDSIAAQEVMVNNTKIPVGRSYKDNLKNLTK